MAVPTASGRTPRLGRLGNESEDVLHALLASNEASWAPLPAVTQALSAAQEELHRYPDREYRELRDVLATFTGVNSDQVVVGHGSAAILRDLIGTLATTGDEVVYPDPSFDYYATAIGVARARPVAVPLRTHQMDLERMAAAVTASTRLILLCNPNNPTGTVVSESDLVSFLASVPEDVVVVVDEAYQEFVTRVDAPDTVNLLRQHWNLVLTRTFSKAYGLAALRCGYGILNPELARRLRETSVPFGVSTFAQYAAIASLTPQAQDQLHARVSLTLSERERLFEGCDILELDPVKSEASFLFIPTAEEDQLADALRQCPVQVRPVRGQGVRIAVGAKAHNDLALAALERWQTSSRR